MAVDDFNQWFSIISFVISIGLAISFWLSHRYQNNKHRKYIKQTINNNVCELVNIIETIHNKADDVYDNKQKAKTASSYFSKRHHRMELLRLNIENLLVQLSKNDSYKQKINAVLEIESWLIDTYSDPTVDEDKRFYLWKSNVGDLTHQTKNAVDLATELKIIRPTVIS